MHQIAGWCELDLDSTPNPDTLPEDFATLKGAAPLSNQVTQHCVVKICNSFHGAIYHTFMKDTKMVDLTSKVAGDLIFLDVVSIDFRPAKEVGHWVVAGLVRASDGVWWGVQLDPMSPNSNHEIYDPAVSVAIRVLSKLGQIERHRIMQQLRWMTKWEDVMPLLLPGCPPGPAPAMQRLEATECGVWCLLLVYIVMCVRAGRVSAADAVRAIAALDRNVYEFRKIIAILL